MLMSQSANNKQRGRRRLALAVMAGGLAVGCGNNDNGKWTVDPDGFDGLGQQTFYSLAAICTINNTTKTMALFPVDGETLYLTLRATDGKVVADAQDSLHADCVVPATYTITITGELGAGKGEKVFLDYLNGPFALGATGTPGLTMVLGPTSSLIVRGSAAADKIYFGSTYAAGGALLHSWINVNGDTSPDVRFDGPLDVNVTTGAGADIISADGGNGTTGVALDKDITFSAYGGPDGDTLTGGLGGASAGLGTNTLDGGAGDDKFVQSANQGEDTIIGGTGWDTVDYSVRTCDVAVTTCSATQCTNVATACKTAFNTCNTTAGTAQTTCTTTADTAQTTCIGDATAGCVKDEDDCETACTGDALCIALCQADSTCEDACDATHTTAVTACDDAHTYDVSVCNATHNSCEAARVGGSLPDCDVCIADDGCATEADTINSDVETVLGGKGADSLSVTRNLCTDGVTTTVKCTVKGSDGNDSLLGSPYADTLDGGAGDDLLQGGLGDDSLIGGAGVDTVSYADRTATAVKVSLDAAKLWVTSPAKQNGASGENDTIAADIENLTGGGVADLLRGNSSNNVIHGGGGNDTIAGGAGNDSLYGDTGGDLLYGGAGNDTLVGGTAASTLVGGDGDDFIDSSDNGLKDTIQCDGVNDSIGTLGTSAGAADVLVEDGLDNATSLTLCNQIIQ